METSRRVALKLSALTLLLVFYQNCNPYHSQIMKSQTSAEDLSSNSNAGEDLVTPPPPSVPGAFIPPNGLQIIGTDGNYIPGENTRRGPVFANNKIFVAYMANGTNNTGSGANEIIAAMYDYATGVWTKKLVAAAARSGNEGHNSPSVFIGPTGHLEIYYGSLSCGYGFQDSVPDPGFGPCYKISLKPYDISDWGTEQHLPSRGSLNNIIGGFTSDGALHLLGQGAYTRRSANGQWDTQKRQMLPNYSGGALGIPGSIQDTLTVGNTVHFVWSVYNGSGAGRRLYYAKSIDGGGTWTNIAGTQSFAIIPSTPVQDASWHPTIPYPAYPASFQIHANNTSGNPEVEVLSDGTVVVAEANLRQFHRWSGTQWVTTQIRPGENDIYALEFALNKLANDVLVLHAINGVGYNIEEFVSRDRGATWTREIIYRKTTETQQKSLEAAVGKSPGQKDRIILHWHRMRSDRSDVAILERVF